MAIISDFNELSRINGNERLWRVVNHRLGLSGTPYELKDAGWSHYRTPSRTLPGGLMVSCNGFSMIGSSRSERIEGVSVTIRGGSDASWMKLVFSEDCRTVLAKVGYDRKNGTQIETGSNLYRPDCNHDFIAEVVDRCGHVVGQAMRGEEADLRPTVEHILHRKGIDVNGDEHVVNRNYPFDLEISP